MIELPEAITLGRQAYKTLAGKIVTDVHNATHLHKFTFFNGNPLLYRDLLTGRQVMSSEGYGIFVDIRFNDNVFLTINDGINMRYGDVKSKVPGKYQLLITFNDDTFISFTTAMYGSIIAFSDNWENKYRDRSLTSISPLNDDFNEQFFDKLIGSEKKNISAKALLATEQRIPGTGNGVLQDILFTAGIHPKRKIFSLSDNEKSKLFNSLKNTLREMTKAEGRDTETDFFGNKGKYRTILSKNTYNSPCPQCDGTIHKEAYMGGSVYYCPYCQKLP